MKNIFKQLRVGIWPILRIDLGYRVTTLTTDRYLHQGVTTDKINKWLWLL